MHRRPRSSAPAPAALAPSCSSASRLPRFEPPRAPPRSRKMKNPLLAVPLVPRSSAGTWLRWRPYWPAQKATFVPDSGDARRVGRSSRRSTRMSPARKGWVRNEHNDRTHGGEAPPPGCFDVDHLFRSYPSPCLMHGQAGWLATIACLTKMASLLKKVGPRSMQSRRGSWKTWKGKSVWGPSARTASSDEDAARAAGHAACSPVHEAAR
jgi:hypothetical protein